MLESTSTCKRSLSLIETTVQFLSDIMAVPSVSSNEQELTEVLYSKFKELGLKVEKCYISEDIKKSEYYSSPLDGNSYENRFNLRISRLEENPDLPKVVINTHCDVVGLSKNQKWGAEIVDDTVFGRGACDAKGQIAVIFLFFSKLLQQSSDQLLFEPVAHIVVEEESGGNGTLSIIDKDKDAKFAIVLEPTENKVCTFARGAVWFNVQFNGESSHSGSQKQSVNAILAVKEVIELITKYHEQLKKESQEISIFKQFGNAIPLTFGRLEAGSWYSTVADKAVLYGVIGFLMNKTGVQVTQELKDFIKASMTTEYLEKLALRFPYIHDCSVTDNSNSFVKRLLQSQNDCGCPNETGVMLASCDATFYSNILEIPTVIFGPGSLCCAHSEQEKVAIAEIVSAAKILAQFAGKT